jgi:hypothetical protein
VDFEHTENIKDVVEDKTDEKLFKLRILPNIA